MTIGEHDAFRVTRNADLALEEDEADDLLGRGRDGAAPAALRPRRAPRDRRRRPVRGCATGWPPSSTWRPTASTRSTPRSTSSGLWAVYGLDRPDLHEETWTPMTPPHLATAGNEPADLFAVLRERDVLVHHPYDSFATSVEAFVAQAADDPDVLGHQADPLPHLGRQPDRGLAHPGGRGGQAGGRHRRAEGPLRRAGQHRVGPGARGGRGPRRLRPGRAEDPLQDRRWCCGARRTGIRRYCHVGTGNYNSKTARIYEDLGLLTADPRRSGPTSATCSTTSPASAATPATASSWSRR